MTDMDLSFLAPPDEVVDWRRIVLTATALHLGVLERLPGSASDVAADLRLDSHSVRALLDSLAIWDIVAKTDSGYQTGAHFPDEDEIPILQQHAQFMHRWTSELDVRMAERIVTDRAPRPPAATAAWLHALGTRARRQAPNILDRCLTYFPETKTVLDLAGGHGEYGLEARRRGKSVTLLDMPQVIDLVSKWDSIADSGIKLVPADIFEHESDEQFDLVLCFGFSHTQPADLSGELFSKLSTMTTPGGGIAVNTFLRNRSPVSELFAIQMLLAGGGGDTHRLEDYTRWLTDAGFDEPQTIDIESRTLLLARKPHLDR